MLFVESDNSRLLFSSCFPTMVDNIINHFIPAKTKVQKSHLSYLIMLLPGRFVILAAFSPSRTYHCVFQMRRILNLYLLVLGLVLPSL